MRFACLGCLLLPLGRARSAEMLGPDELVLVCNRLEPAGVELARRYAQVRGVPADRLCLLDLPPRDDEIDAADFERRIRAPIRDWLTTRALRDRVRGLVLFYGLPIRVRELPAPPGGAALRADWRRGLADALASLERLTGELERLAGNPLPPLASSAPAPDDWARLARAYGAARTAAMERLVRAGRPAGAEDDWRRLLAIIEQVEGVSAVVARATPSSGPGRTSEQDLAALRQTIRRDRAAAFDLLALAPDHPDRQRGRRMLARLDGLIALIASDRNDLARLDTAQSSAAVDSELTLLWWRVYPRTRWVLNPLSWRWWGDANLSSSLPPGDRDEPVMLVARLDGPNPDVVRCMIDDAAHAEKTGLVGRVYVDARGLAPDTPHGRYDQNLRDFAALVRRHTALPLTLDDRPALLQPDCCPGAMLYCGWYSLRQYVDAFTFVPGAVGYHIASFEAASLRLPGETGWCRGLLLNGAAATLGPVAEPYAEAFPRPADFFGLLLTGRFTLAECFAFTNPFHSWMMTLLGDPLYRPFAARPLLAVEQVFEPDRLPPEFRTPSRHDEH